MRIYLDVTQRNFIPRLSLIKKDLNIWTSYVSPVGYVEDDIRTFPSSHLVYTDYSLRHSQGL